MAALSKILASTDFSEQAAMAVTRAAQLARSQRATLHLLHVIDRTVMQLLTGINKGDASITDDRLTESAHQRLAELASQLTQRFGVPVRRDVLAGRIHSELAGYAVQHQIDLCVLGAHGENYVKDMFVGSAASRFLRRARSPALIVRSDPMRPYEEVLVAVDFSEASRLAVQLALRIAPTASIRAVHVSEVPFEGKMRYAGIQDDDIALYRRSGHAQARSALDAFLVSIEGADRMERTVIDGTPALGVIAQALARGVDLVVMGKRGRFELDEFLLGSVALRVLEEIDRDLLLVAPPARPGA